MKKACCVTLILCMARLASVVISFSPLVDDADVVVAKQIPVAGGTSLPKNPRNYSGRRAPDARTSRSFKDGNTKGRRRNAAAKSVTSRLDDTASTDEDMISSSVSVGRSRRSSSLRKLAKEEDGVVVTDTTNAAADGKDATGDSGANDDVLVEIYKTKSPTVAPVVTKSPVQGPAAVFFVPAPVIANPVPPPVFVQPPAPLPTLGPVSAAPILVPATSTTTVVGTTTTSWVPVPAPTAYPIRSVPPLAPTTATPIVAPAMPTIAFNSSSTQPASIAPTFNNHRQTEILSLNNFEVSVQAAVNASLDERKVVHVFLVDIRKAAQDYLKEAMPYENLLYVQLHPLERRRNRRRRNLSEQDIVESFQYGGEAVFQDSAPDHGELLIAQQRALNDTATFQSYIHKTATLKDVELTGAVFQDQKVTADTVLGGSVSLIAVIAVASGVSLAVLLLIVCMICKLCRRPRNLPPPTHITAKKSKSGEDFNPYGEGTNATDTDDEGAKPLEQLPRRVDIPQSGSNGTGATHVGGTFSTDASEPAADQQSKRKPRGNLTSILRTKKRAPEQPYSVPVIERADSGDSMDGYSLESGRQGQQHQQQQLRSLQDRAKSAKPSWLSPSTASVNTSDNESLFSYDNIPGTNRPAVSALGPALYNESLDDEIEVTTSDSKTSRALAGSSAITRQAPSAVAAASPPYTKGCAQTPSRVYEGHDEDSFVVPPLESKSRATKGFEDESTVEQENLPFDESMDDSVELDLDVFSAELEKIKRDIAARRKEQSS